MNAKQRRAKTNGGGQPMPAQITDEQYTHFYDEVLEVARTCRIPLAKVHLEAFPRLDPAQARADFRELFPAAPLDLRAIWMQELQNRVDATGGA